VLDTVHLWLTLQRKCGVEVSGLRAGSKQDAAKLKAGEDAKQKSYRAVCRLSCAPTPEQLAALNAMTVRMERIRAAEMLCVMAMCAQRGVVLCRRLCLRSRRRCGWQSGAPTWSAPAPCTPCAATWCR
jgi:hypothetical protein